MCNKKRKEPKCYVIHKEFKDVKTAQRIHKEKRYMIVKTYRCKYGNHHITTDKANHISFLLKNREEVINHLFKKGIK